MSSDEPATMPADDSAEAQASAQPPAPRPDLDDEPPFLGSWRNIYIFVLGTLVVLITLFALLTEHYQ